VRARDISTTDWRVAAATVAVAAVAAAAAAAAAAVRDSVIHTTRSYTANEIEISTYVEKLKRYSRS